MAQTTSGKVLREARERKGYDLNTVARRLRIRPDILRAIEAGDYNAMPPRGYTRNMVNAYAKLLGLNPTEIVNMYLDEAYAQQVEKARGSGPRSGFNMQRETRRSRSQLGVGENSGAETRAIHPIPSDDGGTRQFTRVLYDDGTRFSRDDYGVTRERTGRPGKSDRDFLSHHSGYDSTNADAYAQSTARRGSRNIYAGQTPMQYSASRLPSFMQSRAFLLGLGIVIIVIVIVVLVVVLGGRNNAAQEDVSTLPVSGISDTTGTDEASASAAAVDVAPTSARVIYSVKSGDECYVEIYSGTNMTPENLTGPTEKTVDVTDTWTIATWSPETLKVTVDGQSVELKANSKYGGMYSYTVDFAEILKQWQATHKGSGASASASSGSAAAATAGAAAAATGAGAAAATSSTDDGTNYDESADPTRGLENQSDSTEEEEYVEDETQEEEYVEDQEETYYDDGTYEEETYDDGSYYEEQPQEEY